MNHVKFIYMSRKRANAAIRCWELWSWWKATEVVSGSGSIERYWIMPFRKLCLPQAFRGFMAPTEWVFFVENRWTELADRKWMEVLCSLIFCAGRTKAWKNLKVLSMNNLPNLRFFLNQGFNIGKKIEKSVTKRRQI